MKILWLSDFHFRKEYKTNKYVKRILDDFFDKVNAHKNEITHVIFNGDISFDASNDSYLAFNEFFFKRLQRTLHDKKIRYMAVPGNHDVKWSEVKAMYERDDETSSAIDFYNREKQELEENRFTMIFDGFNSDSNQIKGVYNRKQHYKYSNNNYGYFYDSSYNCLFILINSAWFSFGDVPHVETFKEIGEQLKFDGIKNTINQIAKIKNELMVEQGYQTYAWNLFMNKYGKEIEKIITDKDPFTISVAHHPPTWLHWKEQFTSEYKNAPPLTELFEKSNLHLVGHEHCAPLIGNISRGKCLILNAGMFLDDSVTLKDDKVSELKIHEKYYPNNWFSILEFNDNMSLLKHQSFNYSHIDRGKFIWKKLQPIEYRFFEDKSVKVEYNTTSVEQPEKISREDDKNEVSKKNDPLKITTSFPNGFNYFDYLLKRTDNSISKHWTLNETRFVGKDLIPYKFSNCNTKIRFFIGTLEEVLMNTESIIEITKLLKKWFNKNEIQITDIYISLIDFYTINKTKELTKEDYIKIDDFIKKREMKYNSFKHHFFNFLIEDDFDLFRILQDVRFTYKVLDVNTLN